jgi:glycosyltransferase 2 family protein
MRKLIVALALLLGVVFVIVQMAQVQAIVETLQRGDLRFIGLALIVQAVWILNLAVSYRTIYRALAIEESTARLAVVASAANFVNVVAPSAGMGGIAVFISEARRRGYSAARVTVAGVLFVFFEYIGFLFILSLGLVVLMRRNDLDVGEVTASALLFALASFLALVIYLGMTAPQALGRMLAFLAHAVNRVLNPFIHREYLSELRAHSFAQEAASGLSRIRQHPQHLFLPAVLSVTSKALLVGILMLMFLAFKVPFSIGTLIAGFSMAYLFLIISPTPAGLGFVEGVLTLSLRSLNVPLGAATVIALSYRGITFWFPWFFGMIAFRWLSKGGAVASTASENQEA